MSRAMFLASPSTEAMQIGSHIWAMTTAISSAYDDKGLSGSRLRIGLDLMSLPE